MNKKKKGFIKGISGIQIMIAIALLILEKLCYERALVMRHVYTKKVMYLSTIWSEDNIYMFLIATILFVSFNYLQKRFHYKKSNLKSLSIESLLIISISLFLLIIDPHQINVYAYALNSIIVLLLLYILKYNVLTNFFDRNDKIFIQM